MTDSAVQTDSRTQREAMVAQQIAARGVRDPLVLRAMREVPREAFLAEELREFAYEDSPLPICRCAVRPAGSDRNTCFLIHPFLLEALLTDPANEYISVVFFSFVRMLLEIRPGR